MKNIIPLLMVMAAAPAYAQLYKWTDAAGKLHYSDRPQDGAAVKEVAVQRSGPSNAAAVDDWRQRERESRERRMHREEANQEAADAVSRAPTNANMHRSNKPMTEQRRR